MAYMIDSERFETAEDAVAWVEANQVGTIETTVDAWVVPDQYIGPMYDTVTTVEYRMADGAPIQVRYLLTDSQTEGRDMEDWPWDAADVEIVADGVNVVEVE